MRSDRPSASAQSVLAARAHFHRSGVLDDRFAEAMLSAKSAAFVRVLGWPGLGPPVLTSLRH